MKICPLPARWSSDNFNHLFEQPTQFYAIVLTLAVLKADNPINLGFAWGYVGVRIAHSLVQTISNQILVRFQLFALSGTMLASLTLRAALLVF